MRETAEVDEETGEASAKVEAEEGQQVSVEVPEETFEEEDESRVEEVNVEASGDGEVSVTVSRSTRDQASETAETRDNQVSFSNIEIDGEVETSNIYFTVDKDTLDERDAEATQVNKERYSEEDDEWETLPTRIDDERDEEFRFEADVEDNSLFAVSIEEDLEADIQVTDLEVELLEEVIQPPVTGNITYTVENLGSTEGTKTVTVEVEGNETFQS